MLGKRITLELPFEWDKIWKAAALASGYSLSQFLFTLCKLGWEVWKDQNLGEPE